MKTLLLVDGSSYLYRAFHALPDLRSPQGEPTGAIYGVLNMLRKLRAENPADYSACVFDAKGKTFRDELYPEYKATRKSMPESLAAQIEPLHQAIVASGWNILMVDGVEADDVIGTLTQQATQGGARCIVSTGDKDLTQLVNSQVQLVNTMSNEWLDEAGVLAKFGVAPQRILDYLTLIGDSVDNVPGVAKVGPKTAVKWLAQYGTLDNVVTHAHEIGGVVGENLRNALDWLPQARKLLTVKCDVALPLPFDQLLAPQPDNEQLRELYTRFGFKTWLRELNNTQQLAAPAGTGAGAGSPIQSSLIPAEAPNQGELTFAPAVNYETILTEHQLDAWLIKMMQAEIVCIDVLTTELDVMNAQLVGISFALGAHDAAYLPLAHRYPGAPQQITVEQVLKKLQPWLESSQHKKVGHNLKIDQHVFANHRIALAGIAEDTMLQSYVLESYRSHEKDNLVQRHLDIKSQTYAELVGKGAKQICFDQVEVPIAARYAAEDAGTTWQVYQLLRSRLTGRLNDVYRNIELPARQVLFVMERNGVLLDINLLNAQSRELGEKLLDIETRAHQIAGQPFNLNSPKQIQEVLFDKLGLPVRKKTPGGTPSTDEEVLQELALDYPLPKLLLDYRGMAKLKSTYTDKLPLMVDTTTGRVHTNYLQAVAVTGRLASNDPNLQNIPIRTAEGRRIREAFVAPPGSFIVSADYSQIELRIMAHLSDDPGLLAAFAKGEDIHKATAAEVFAVPLENVSSEQRRYAKVINFGLIYGMSAFGLATQLGVARPAAQAYIDRYFARYPGVADYMQRTRELARQQGYVETVFGRRLWLPEINGGNGMRRQAAERAAINAPMQGTAADLIKLAMVAVQNWLESERLHSLLVMQVHDELVLEVREQELARIKDSLPGLMSNVAALKVPLEVGLGMGKNWDEAH